MAIFYTKRPLYLQLYILPFLLLGFLYLYDVLIGLFIFAVLEVLIFLFSTWFLQFKLFSQFQKSHKKITKKQKFYVLYQNKLCRVLMHKDLIYFINNKLMHKIEIKEKKYEISLMDIKTDEPFEVFKKGEFSIKYNELFKNEFSIESPNFILILYEHFIEPFFVFQVFSCLLWCLDEHVNHALIALGMTVLFEALNAFQRYITIKRFKSFNIPVMMIGEHMTSKDLKPGDIINLDGSLKSIPCDLLIIEGTAVTNEAMLSGESIPLVKESILERKGVFDYEKDKINILFGGTELICSNARCVVIKTGFYTQQGKLLRMMMTKGNVVSQNNKEAYLFILGLLGVAICASIYSVYKGFLLKKSNYKILIESILILTNVVPTELPLELTVCVNLAIQKLMRLKIFCLEPFRLPLAGKLDVCFFDKTGTLTETFLEVEEVKSNEYLNCLLVVGGCNSLVKVNDELQGDPIDLATFKYFNLNLEGNEILFKENKKISIIKKFLFSSENKRATSVINYEGKSYVVMKGAPEMVENFIKPVPNFNEYKKYAAQGSRVLAVAIKVLEPGKKKPLKREELEKDLLFCGFILFSCKLKKGTGKCIRNLLKAGLGVKMITGDNKLTAISIAKQLNFYNNKILENKEIDEYFDKKKKMDYFYETSVFARTSPKQKEKIVEMFKQNKKTVLFAGDGTNDVGALKSADIGVAICEQRKKIKKQRVLNTNKTITDILTEELVSEIGQASVAAPFSTQSNTLDSILHIIREGRASLVSTIQMYKVLALNSLITAFTLAFIGSLGVSSSDAQLILAGLFISFTSVFVNKAESLEQISVLKPLGNILNKYILFSVVFQGILHIFTFLIVIYFTERFEKIVYVEKFKPSLINTTMFLTSMAQQNTTTLVNYIGRPFRKDLFENRMLILSLAASFSLIFSFIFFENDLSKTLELVFVPFPLNFILVLVILSDFLLCFLFEKLFYRLFFIRNTKEKVD